MGMGGWMDERIQKKMEAWHALGGCGDYAVPGPNNGEGQLGLLANIFRT